MPNKQNLPLTDAAYNQLRQDILSCNFEPGSLISQSFLSKKYNLGKSPINSALQKLIQEGLIRSVPRVGYFVSSLTVRDVNELYEALFIIEVNTATLAVKHGSDENLKQILAMSDFSYVHKDQNSYFSFLEMNKNFHRQIALASGNSRLVEILTKILEDINRIFYLGLDIRDSAEEIRDEHHNLAVALCNRDVDKVIELSKKQIMRSQEQVTEALYKRGLNQSNVSLQDLIQGENDRYDGVFTIHGDKE
jgi:DNA-binding GntR family transcriptional regulator